MSVEMVNVQSKSIIFKLYFSYFSTARFTSFMWILLGSIVKLYPEPGLTLSSIELILL